MLKQRLSVIGLILLIFVLSTHALERQPPPCFDEGWVLSLARNWVELGHYGHFLLGEPVPSTILNAGFPVIVPVALSFRVLGVGIWQGRLPGVFFLIIMCSLLYRLAYQINGPRVGLWTLIFALFFPIHPDLQPIFMGRQALGEIFGVCYLLAGYKVLFLSWCKNKYIVIVSLLFALALQTKPQFLPFFVVSMMVPLLLLWSQQRSKEFKFLMLSLLLALAFSQLFYWAWAFLLRSDTREIGGNPYAMVQDITVLFTYVIVLNPAFRLFVLRNFLSTLSGALVVPGLICYGYQRTKIALNGNIHYEPRFVWAMILWLFASSWCCWFFFLSIGFLRYLFPGLLIGSILVAPFFYELTCSFDLIAFIRDLARSIHNRFVGGRFVLQFLSAVFLLVAFIATLRFLNGIVDFFPENPYVQVLEFLNTETNVDALIETYESELFLFLERDYHYPPDYVQHVLNRRAFLGEDLPLIYDPMEFDVDYVVIGWSKFWHLYDSLLDSENFELIYQNSRYHVYRRISNIE